MTPTEIPSEEIEFHFLSFADTNGRVFWWKRELPLKSPKRPEFKPNTNAKPDLYE
jgi:hypothetical protein